jgi:predicted DNA-binding antitoxin AbrB/MazE fold protein
LGGPLWKHFSTFFPQHFEHPKILYSNMPTTTVSNPNYWEAFINGRATCRQASLNSDTAVSDTNSLWDWEREQAHLKQQYSCEWHEQSMRLGKRASTPRDHEGDEVKVWIRMMNEKKTNDEADEMKHERTLNSNTAVSDTNSLWDWERERAHLSGGWWGWVDEKQDESSRSETIGWEISGIPRDREGDEVKVWMRMMNEKKTNDEADEIQQGAECWIT